MRVTTNNIGYLILSTRFSPKIKREFITNLYKKEKLTNEKDKLVNKKKVDKQEKAERILRLVFSTYFTVLIEFS